MLFLALLLIPFHHSLSPQINAYLAPFIKNTTASSAFCLLYKLWTLRLSVNQVTTLLEHPDSPYPSFLFPFHFNLALSYIRGIGFLYLRYVLSPKELWSWFSYYLEDEEKLIIQPSAPKSLEWTIGRLCRELLTMPKFCGTMLPRIPIPVAKDIQEKLANWDKQKDEELLPLAPPPPPPPPAPVQKPKLKYAAAVSKRHSPSSFRDEPTSRHQSRDYRDQSPDRFRRPRRSRSRSRSQERCRSRERYREVDRDRRYSHHGLNKGTTTQSKVVDGEDEYDEFGRIKRR